MLGNQDREKLINSILFFSQKTKYCGMTKLFKLLYFLDFEHYKLTGRSVTGLTYFAYPMGPVPKTLKNEIPKAVQPDLAAKVRFEEIPTKKGNDFIKVIPLARFDPDLFSQREMNIMSGLANEYANVNADDIIEATHLDNKPWDRVFNQEKRRQKIIPYEYAVRDEDKELIQHLKKENDEIVLNYGA